MVLWVDIPTLVLPHASYTAKASKSERNAGLEGFEAVNVLGYEFDPDNPYKSGK